MQPVLILQLLILLLVANGTPVVAKKVLGNFLAHPLDGAITFVDGRPVLGPSKTIRGVVLSILLTSSFAPLIGVSWKIGLLIGFVAMIGDTFSSFLKRRMNLEPSTMALGLDQVPESLLPLLACRSTLALTILDITAVVVMFLICELALSRLLFKLNIRDRPF
jgi:CDP-2,3-bis-(O-geranylgeranyl)-sn-glycerol synthase